MIVYKKMAMVYMLSVVVSLYVTSWAMEARKELIDAKIVLLKNERSEKRKELARKYGDSTMAYRVASKAYFSQSNEELEKLQNERNLLQAKL